MPWTPPWNWLLMPALALVAIQPAAAERNTYIQDASPWMPQADVQSDVTMIYGYGDLPARAANWRLNGYHPAFMTGVAWGEYQDFLDGRFDGVNHADHAQMRRNGTPILHGPTVPYMVPSKAFLAFMEHRLKEVIDAGIDEIFLEEPEFWAASGYSESFKREFKEITGKDWVAPHESVDARYQVAKVQYALYGRAIDYLMSYCKRYGAEQGRTIKCYLATHSLVNYAAWGLVTPESSLNQIKSLDGYILQIWTGTARHINHYRGQLRSRTFETAFLEYGQMAGMFAGTGRDLIALVDPIEDDPAHGWDDYEYHYKRTLTAALFQPSLTKFEIAPWPSRVFARTYPANESTARQPDAPRVPIPPDYAAVYLACSNAMAAMPSTPVTWNASSRNVGVLVADSLMFQREEPTPSDQYLGSFFGLALPLVKSAIPTQVISLENLSPAAIDGMDVLVLTYEGMKPPSAAVHEQLAQWVRAGHGLVLIDDFADPYNAVKEWWNTGDLHFAHPAQHLFEQLGLPANTGAGTYACGAGTLHVIAASPAALARREDGDQVVAAAVHATLTQLKQDADWKDQPHMELRRGSYRVAANVDETRTTQVQQLAGVLVDLYDPQLAVKVDPVLNPGDVGFFVDLEQLQAPAVVAATTRVRNVQAEDGHIRFDTRGPQGTPCRIRLLLPSAPTKVEVREGSTTRAVTPQWDAATRTALIELTNQAATIAIDCQF